MSPLFGKAKPSIGVGTMTNEAVPPATERLSVKTRVTLVATLLFLLSLLLVSAVQIYNVKEGMKTVLVEQQHAFVARVADDLDQKLKLHLDFVEAVTRTMPAEAIGDPAKLQKWADERHGLRAIFNDIFFVSAKGVVLADTPQQGRRGIDVSDREYFRATVATRKPHISRPFIGRTIKQPVVTFSAPVLDKDGAVVLVLSGSLNLLQSNFLGNLAEAKVGKSGSFSVFTRNRTIVISPDKSRILAQGPAPGVSPYFDRATSGLEGSEEGVGIHGGRAIHSYTRLEAVPWVLVASLPIDEAYAPIQATQRRVVEVTLLLGLLIAPLVWLAVRRLYDPLRRSLGEQEMRFRTVVESAPTGMVIIDATGAMVMVNAQTEKLFGYQRDELLGRRIEMLIPERFRRVHPAMRDGFFSAPQARQMGAGRELYGRRKDGTEIPVEIGLSPVAAEEGQLVLAVIVDITEHKRAEETLRASEARARGILDTMFAFVGLMTPDGTLIEVNRAALEAAGQQRDAVLGQPVADTFWLSHSTDTQNQARDAVRHAAAGEVVRCDLVVRIVEGRLITLDVVFAPLRDDAGRVIQIVGSGVDVTERKRAQDALRELSWRLLETEETERRNINRELHDRIGQNLSALGLNLGLVRTRLSGDSLNAVGARFDDMEKLLETTSRDVRNIMTELRPTALDDYGLLAALRIYARTLSDRLGVPIDVRGSEPSPRPPIAVETALFRIAQEALNNVAKHARATRVEIGLDSSAKGLGLTIADDGAGFDTNRLYGQSTWGMSTMRERAQAIGARFRVKSAPGRGTRVIIELDGPARAGGDSPDGIGGR